MIYSKEQMEEATRLAQTEVQALTDSQLVERSTVCAIYAKAIYDECMRRQTDLAHVYPAGHA